MEKICLICTLGNRDIQFKNDDELISLFDEIVGKELNPCRIEQNNNNNAKSKPEYYIIGNNFYDITKKIYESIENNEENNSSIYDGKIITNSKLNIMLNEVKEKNEKQMELERLKKRMKEYKKPLEKELLAIKQRHPELSKSILEYVAKLNRAETPQQLMNVINELQEWLKQYSIALPEDVIEKTIKNLKTEQLNDNERWRQLLR